MRRAEALGTLFASGQAATPGRIEMGQYRTFMQRLPKSKPAKAAKKRLATSNIARRYMELLRLREILKAEAVAR
jgi:hypothetical protein